MATIKHLQELAETSQEILQEVDVEVRKVLKGHVEKRGIHDDKHDYHSHWEVGKHHLTNHVIDRDYGFERKNPYKVKDGKVHLPTGLYASGDDDAGGEEILSKGHYHPHEIGKAIKKHNQIFGESVDESFRWKVRQNWGKAMGYAQRRAKGAVRRFKRLTKKGTDLV